MIRSIGMSISRSKRTPSEIFILNVRTGSVISSNSITRSELRISSRLSSKLLKRRGSRSITKPIVSINKNDVRRKL